MRDCLDPPEVDAFYEGIRRLVLAAQASDARCLTIVEGLASHLHLVLVDAVADPDYAAAVTLLAAVARRHQRAAAALGMDTGRLIGTGETDGR